VRRISLETDLFITAKDLLPGKLKELRKLALEVGTFGDARILYEADLEADHALVPESKQYRRAR
jgi:hypothetical protein